MINYALCIGINNYGHGADLAGCRNDALDWADVCRQQGARVETVVDGEATRQHLLDAMLAISSRTKRGQTAVITYSGHGTWVPDVSGDEADRRDEALCPVDVWSAGPITDDRLFGIFGDRAWGARIVLISDSCYSGTVTRLVDLTRQPQDRRAKPRFLPPGEFLQGRALARAEQLGTLRDARPRTSALLMAGCRDDQVSYDAWFDTPDGDRANGAFTWAALQARQQLGPRSSYQAWLTATRRTLAGTDYDQQPQLDGSLSQKRWRVL